MEIASAQLQRPDKGDDAYIVRSLDNIGSAKLIAVADGLSLNDGKAAANWVINHLTRITDADSPRTILEGIRRELSQSQYPLQSETTLTCGILQKIDTAHHTFLRFEYFAIGDSPIWKVVTGDSRYPFQRFLVHGTPYPAETARVYSTVRLHEGDIKGRITFGAIEIEHNEVLVVCTDGIPEREIFVKDISNAESSDSISLCRWLFQVSPYDNDKLAEVLLNYDKRGVLFDDATIVTARLLPLSVNDANTHQANSVNVESKPITLIPSIPTEASLSVESVDNLLSETEVELIPPTTPFPNSTDGGLRPEQDRVEQEEIHEINPSGDASDQRLASTPPDSENEAMSDQGEYLSSPQSGVAPDCGDCPETDITEEKADSEKSSAPQIEDQNVSPNEPSSQNSSTGPRGRNRRRKNT